MFGIMPCAIVSLNNKHNFIAPKNINLFKGLGSQFPELVDYLRFGEQSKVPTFSGHFPIVCHFINNSLIHLNMNSGHPLVFVLLGCNTSDS
jgi:hypothetical protein